MLDRYPVVLRFTFYLLFVILLIYGLIEARNFFYPLFIAVLFAYLLYPLASFLEKHGIPRILANLTGILFAGVIIAAGVFFIYKQIGVFVEDFPSLRQNAMANVDELEGFIEENFGVSSTTQHQWIRERISNFFESSTQFFTSAFSATTATLAKIGLMPVYVFFMLYYRNKFRNFMLLVIPESKHAKTEKILNEVSFVTERYMGGVFVVVLILCVLNSIGLLIVGLKYAILLGIISALFNFIPYFGTLIGGIIPLFYALLLSPYPQKAVGVIILFIIVQFMENNILTPNITGGNVKLNPFITILSIIVGGMIWGIPGMFLSVPLLAMFKIICDYVEPLKPYSYLLGTSGTEQHALSINKISNFFKRKPSD
ncbi:MAG: AI-2E family transporter [Candidatus Cyclobacteriaceae bacterium M3_2C_046]